MGPVRGKGTGEQALAGGLLGSLHAGDAAARRPELLRLPAVAGRGRHRANLLWRVKASLHLPVVRPLPDGSWLSVIPDLADVRRRTVRNGARRRRGSKRGPDTGPLPGITVRVIQFWLTVATDDGVVRTERYRLITTLLDHRRYPAAGLAAGYARRWAIETGFREFKTYLRGPGRILRGRTPELARQELWAYLALYQAIRAIMCLAAAVLGLDPDRISFTATLQRRPPHRSQRAHQPRRRPGRHRSGHLDRAGPRPRWAVLRPGRHPARVPVPVQGETAKAPYHSTPSGTITIPRPAPGTTNQPLTSLNSPPAPPDNPWASQARGAVARPWVCPACGTTHTRTVAGEAAWNHRAATGSSATPPRR